MIQSFDGKKPQIADSAFVSESAHIIIIPLWSGFPEKLKGR